MHTSLEMEIFYNMYSTYVFTADNFKNKYFGGNTINTIL